MASGTSGDVPSRVYGWRQCTKKKRAGKEAAITGILKKRNPVLPVAGESGGRREAVLEGDEVVLKK